MKKLIFAEALIFTLIPLLRLSAFYVEGIDTTDAAGYGMDSSFKAESYRIAGARLIYGFIFGREGYFDYSFDEIKKVPDIFHATTNNNLVEDPCAHCFIVQNSKDSTYAKIRILSRLADNRYVFRYGKNTVPNDRLLEKPDYDRNRYYKPNNFHQSFLYFTNDFIPQLVQKNTFTWEPPLQNNHRLLGYILYISKTASIDTTAPVKLSQWEQATFTTSTVFENYGQYSSYINLVAVYEDDTTEFLAGWTHKTALVVKTINHFDLSPHNRKGNVNAANYIFPFRRLLTNTLYQLDGRVISCGPTSDDGTVYGAAAYGIRIIEAKSAAAKATFHRVVQRR